MTLNRGRMNDKMDSETIITYETPVAEIAHLKTVYTQDEVKTIIRDCLAGINTSKYIIHAWYFQEDDSVYQIIDDIKELFSQILHICEAVEQED